MPSYTTTLKVPDLLLQAIHIRAAQLGFSINGFFLSLARYDIMCQGEHTITGAVARAKGWARDKVDAWLLRIAQRGTAKRGVLLNHIVERMQQRRHRSELDTLLDLADEDAEEWSNFVI